MNQESVSVSEFFRNQEIFITGATGFFGKALIEKLLRSCPEVKRIFILARSKKGSSVSDRLKEFAESDLFAKLLSERPKAIDKIIPIEGDVMKPGLGLSPSDRFRLSHVSIVIHSAASVRFDDPLQKAILMNTRGTWEMLKLAETLPQLKVFVYVSTAYSNCDQPRVEEKIHAPHFDWEKAIQMAENFDPEVLNSLTRHLTDFMPNTYVFTKSLAEQVCDSYKERLPIAVYRPAIVMPSEKEPFPGWVLNYFGPIGLSIGGATGLFQSLYLKRVGSLFLTPVDHSVKGLIVATWKRALIDEKNSIPVYNCYAAELSTWNFLNIGVTFIPEFPVSKTIWFPAVSITSCPFIHYIKVFFLQVALAFVVDILLRITGRKPYVMKLQRTMTLALSALHPFMTTKWRFDRYNFQSLQHILSEKDRETFDMYSTSFANYATIRVYGKTLYFYLRRVLLNDPDETLPAARRWYKILKILHTILTVTFFVGLIYLLWKTCCPYASSQNNSMGIKMEQF